MKPTEPTVISEEINIHINIQLFGSSAINSKRNIFNNVGK